jgi:hypothetical protein
VLRRIIVTIGILCLFVAATPISAASAAAPPCHGTSCNGRDPQTTGCGRDARTLEDVEDTGGWVTLELRYSPSCYAAWARVTNFRGVTGVAKVIGYDEGQFRREELKNLAAYRDEVAWTNMISFTYTVYGCYRHFKPITGWTEWCSHAH